MKDLEQVDYTYSLTFETLRRANRMRMPEFKNKHGEAAHSKPDGSDWSPAQWLQAIVGELGEYANLRKKFERGDVSKDEFDREAADELADVVAYVDILAFQLGIDLGNAVISKFNRISKRVGSNVYIKDGHSWGRRAPNAVSAETLAVNQEPKL